MKTITHNASCRICKNTRLTKILSFGSTPPANAFVQKKDLHKKEHYYPLDVYFCHTCNLVQLCDVVNPEILFKNYVYVSSTSPVFQKHFDDFAKTSTTLFHLKPTSLVIDIGSNDGILLQPFHRKNIRVLGIEPAKNIAAIANKKGIATISQFFSTSLAQQISQKYGPADLVTATNVFAHINDLDEVVIGVKKLIGQKGVFMIEAPYLVDFLDNNFFDTVYHEHLSYLAVNPLATLFKRFDMKIIDVIHTNVHGGSIQIFSTSATSRYPVKSSVRRFMMLERRKKLHLLSTYSHFAKRIEANKKRLMALLYKLKQKGKKISGYGAPAKGNTLLQYFGIDTKTLDYIIDDSPYKQQLFTPGTHIPVVAPTYLDTKMPDYLLLLAWNFADSIMKRYQSFHQRGGKFIIPAPKPRIV